MSNPSIFTLDRFMKGESLYEYIKEVKIVSEYETRLIIENILKAVVYCHSRNIIHRYIIYIILEI